MSRRSRVALFGALLVTIGLVVVSPVPTTNLPLGVLTPQIAAAAQPVGSAASGLSPNVLPGVATPATVAGVSYKTIGGQNFSPRDSDLTYGTGGSGMPIWAKANGAEIFAARVDLPQGARITEVVWYIVDNDAVNDAQLFLTRWDGVGSMADLSSRSTTSAATGIQALVTDVTPASIYVDNTASTYELQARLWGESSAILFYGARVGYIAASPDYFPIAPTRVYDSRFGDGTLLSGGTRVVTVANGISPTTGTVTIPNLVPAGARGITYNLTITQTVGVGNLAIYPATGSPSASAINWSFTGIDLANGGTVTISSARQVKVTAAGTAGARTQFIIDVTGYYM